MAFDDFKTEFQRLEICYLGPDTLLDDDEGEIADACRKWDGQLMDGGWKSRVNAGGCRNFSQLYRAGATFLSRGPVWLVGRMKLEAVNGVWTPIGRMLMKTLKIQCLYWPSQGGYKRGVPLPRGKVF